MRISFLSIIATLLLFAVSTFGQNNAEIECELVAHYAQMEKVSSYSGNYDDEILERETELFKQKLLKYAAQQPATLSYKFAELDKSINILTSADGKFRIYSWDTLSGGTMHFFDRVYQYQGADGKVYAHAETALEEGDAGSTVNQIYTQPTPRGTIYLVSTTAVLSNPDRYESIALYKIEGNRLNDKVKLIKTKSGLTNSIGFEYNAFSAADRENPNLIVYEPNTQTLKIPVVIQDADDGIGRVTGKFIIYKFDGAYFVRIR